MDIYKYRNKKNTYDSFANKELKKYLDEQGIETVIVIGGYTHACVDTTIRSAVTKGFDVILVEDLVASPDALQQLHEHAVTVLKTLFAYGTTSKELMKKIK